MDNGTLIAIMRRRRRRQHSNGNGLLKWIAGIIALFLLSTTVAVVFILATGVGSAAGVYAYFTQDLPGPEAVGRRAQEGFKTAKIYDRTGNILLYEIIPPEGGNRTVVPLERIPQHLINATIAIEDRNFYQNPGFNIEGIARAAWNNFRGLPIQGGSSITQQLVKNVIIPPEERVKKSYSRKMKELILSWELSRRYPGIAGKNRILEWYLNTIYYGNLAYGVQAAAQNYFGKTVSELALAESAMLAAMPQYPALTPMNYPEVAKRRQELVLDQMYRQGYITAEEAYAAKQEKLEYAVRSEQLDIVAPHFVMYVRDLLEERFGPDVLYQRGLRIYTTIDLDLQRKALEIARNHVKQLREEQGKNVHNGAVVTLRPRTGEILTMVGSLDFNDESIDGQVNMALAPRQPGSSIKPFTYVTAFRQGYTPASMLLDVRTSFPDPPNPPYAPENIERDYNGPMMVRDALAQSRNIPAVRMLDKVGIENVLDTAHRMGITTLTGGPYGLSLTLGGGEVRALDMAFAYSVFANLGTGAGRPRPAEKQQPGFRTIDPAAILRVEDAEGNVLYKYEKPETREILNPQESYLIVDILSDNEARVPTFGFDNPLQLGDRPVAAKTGSTNDWTDAWTIGFTPQLVTAVWVGNASRESMERMPGSRGAGPIWHDFMEYAHQDLPVEDWQEPPGIVQMEVCEPSGLLPTEQCPETREEIFIEGTEPRQPDNMHQVFRICRPSDKLATVHCPPNQVEEKVFTIYPPEAADWVRANDIPQPPREYDTTYGPSRAAREVAILSPEPYGYVRERVEIRGNARGGNFNLYRVQYGRGLDPSSWSQIGPDHNNQVSGAVLEYWDVSGLEEGLYTLQLLAVDHGGGVRRDAVQVTVDNTPPEVSIAHPWEGKEYSVEDDEWVSLQANATDNVTIDRVEYYIDGELYTYSTVSPYNVKWTLTADAVGEHEIYAIAYDGAGNEVETGKIRINVSQEPEDEDTVGLLLYPFGFPGDLDERRRA